MPMEQGVNPVVRQRPGLRPESSRWPESQERIADPRLGPVEGAPATKACGGMAKATTSPFPLWARRDSGGQKSLTRPFRSQSP